MFSHCLVTQIACSISTTLNVVTLLISLNFYILRFIVINCSKHRQELLKYWFHTCHIIMHFGFAAGVKLWPKSLLPSWASIFQNLLARINFNRPPLSSIGKMCNFLSNSHSFISMLYAFPNYYWNYNANYAHWKLSEICYQTPKCPKKINSFPGPVHLEISRPMANLGSHGPLDWWIFSPLLLCAINNIITISKASFIIILKKRYSWVCDLVILTGLVSLF